MNLYNSFCYCSVEEIGDGRWEAISSIHDTFHEIKVRTVVQRREGYRLMETAAYRILEVEGQMLRIPHDLCRKTTGLLKNLEGMELDTAVRKRVMAEVSGELGCRQLADLVLEGIRGFVQAEFEVRGRPFSDPVERRHFFKRDMEGSCYLYSKL